LEPQTKRFTRDFYEIIVIDACLAIAREMYQPVFSLYLLETRKATPVEIGAIVSIFPLATILARFILGPISDRVGAGWFLLTTLIVQPITFALYVLAPDVSWFYSIQVLSALTIALFNPLLMSLVFRISPTSHSGDAMGRYLTAAGLSTLMGPLLTSILLEAFQRNYSGIFLSAIIPAAVSLCAFLLFTKGKRYREELFTTITRTERSLLSQIVGFAGALKTLFMAENVPSLTISRIAFSFTLAFFRILFPIYAVDSLGYSPSSVTLIFTVYGLFNTLARFPSGRLNDRIGRKLPLILSIALMVLVNIGLSTATEYTSLWTIAAVYGACHGLRAVSEWTFLGDSVSPQFRGLANSYFANIFDIGTSLGAFTGGVMVTLMPVSQIFRIAALIMLGNATAVWFLSRGNPHRKGDV
jgi:MFS family permease